MASTRHHALGAEHRGFQTGGGKDLAGLQSKPTLDQAAPYFTSREMLDFASRSGLGLLTAPAEAHYLMGIEERTIQVILSGSSRNSTGRTWTWAWSLYAPWRAMATIP